MNKNALLALDTLTGIEMEFIAQRFQKRNYACLSKHIQALGVKQITLELAILLTEPQGL